MADDLSSYMREHYNTLIHKEAVVRRRVIYAANRDLLEFVGEIADMARGLQRKYPFSPPSEGEGGTANPPRFTLLRELIGWSSASLLGRMDTGPDVPASGSGPEMANKKKRVVTSKVFNNNSGRANSSWGLVQTLADEKNRGRCASTPRTAADAPATTVLTSMASNQDPPLPPSLS